MKESMEIPTGWLWTKVKEIAINIQYGYTESSSKEKVGPKFLRITDIQDHQVDWQAVPFCLINNEEKKKYLLKDGDLVFARTGATVGKSFLIKGNLPESIFASYLIRLRFPKEAFDKYVWYFFQTPFYWNQIIDKQVGIGQPNVNGTTLGQLEICIPPLPEQHRIVAKIEALFRSLEKGIESLKTAQQQLKIYRQAVLKWAFEGKFTNENVKEGELPKTWKWMKLGEIANKISDGPFGSNLKTSDYVEIGVRVIRLENIGYMSFKNEFQSFVSQEKYETIKKHTVSKGDIIFSSFISENIKAVILPDYIDRAINKADCFLVRTSETEISKRYLTFFFATRAMYNFLVNQIHGATRPRINTTQLKSVQIPLPPLLEQHTVAAAIESRLSVCDKVEESILHSLKQAEALRQSILKKAFEGKLVPQDPRDEPASILLERIKAEKEKNRPLPKKPKNHRSG